MKLTIFGATGGTGRCLTEQAIAAGHEVTVVVRDPARLAVRGPAAAPDRGGRLHVVTADVMDPAAIIPAVAGADAVLSALGPRGSGPTTVSQDSARSIISAMQKSGVRRLVTVSGSVVTDAGEGPSCAISPSRSRGARCSGTFAPTCEAPRTRSVTATWTGRSCGRPG
jgi:putative NADH-flavin reductase